MKNKTIIENAKAAGEFNTLLKMLGKAGLTRKLNSKWPFTVFAPSDKAFAEVPPSELEKWMNNKERLEKILTYHVLQGLAMSADVKKMETVKTLHGRRLDINVTSKGIRVNGAKVLKPDIECSNGVIHIIDSVLTP
ncbi:hypothetical protein A2Y83_01935 [Candidatus Falkowbacteria bacterium RBG_13_39_14]|uniref:FAS1 domain-containing protein n=1 Tax=Candidatus Falkowbacteria bacterium RBG_13_39_14 TaxID=1797985 RepID=A0A1F5S134_9BACT|nr:MAG: hypothetical protein A2Y83_01935 [Candidatus Falkowbacteria bacterium RBG_13_39_14]